MTFVRLGEILLEENQISQEDLDYCLMVQKTTGEKIGNIFKYYDFINEEQLARHIAKQYGRKYFDSEYIPNKKILKMVNIEVFHKHLIYPAHCEKLGEIFICAHPNSTEGTDILLNDYKIIGVKECVGRESRILQELQKIEAETKIQINAIEKEQFVAEIFLAQILNKAIKEKASDIHIEPDDKGISIRLRFDGLLKVVDHINIECLNELTNYIFQKTGQINTSEFSKCHDAKFQYEYLKRKIDIRVSHLPTSKGSELTLRLLDQGEFDLNLEGLSFHPKHQEKIDSALVKPYGIILLTGPTGSGKTTTLYSILNRQKSLEKKIVTAEDPVEYKVSNISQIQINKKMKLNFADAVKQFLRHDPDEILIGEIRDSETAQIAMKAAETGHKVYSTLHTITPFDAILRLQSLGVGESHIANSLVCVISQRLARTLCPKCKEEISIKKESLAAYEKKYIKEDILKAYTAKGCKECFKGYKGRIIVAEVLYVTEELKLLINSKEIKKIYEYISNDKDYITFTKDAQRLIEEGRIDLKEAVRILG